MCSYNVARNDDPDGGRPRAKLQAEDPPMLVRAFDNNVFASIRCGCVDTSMAPAKEAAH
ncbi:hypothetical protein ZHAS_00006958 [Anopheles sinensis]|uniref:Uncharacterized protein n=1 Tax=Anopheles sinensis TaxID=74873 RepID=A0A084VNC1_ANOSI|nr:hypothetical protein ZHAS_00006958 [Anopheles sinensis]